MRDEKEGRKKQARSNKQQGKAKQHTHMYIHGCILWGLASPPQGKLLGVLAFSFGGKILGAGETSESNRITTCTNTVPHSETIYIKDSILLYILDMCIL